MRFIHTADWHLGRLMYGERLTEEQAHVLDQLLYLAKDSRVDVLLISGDVYDRSVPPTDAVELLDQFLSQVVLDLRVPVVIIAGNHDSPNRLQFGARVLAGRGLHVFGSIRTGSSVTIEDAHGPVHLFPIPYCEPVVVKESLTCESVQDHDTAMRALIASTVPTRSNGCRSILLGHAFVAGGIEAESERPLSVGGADKVDASCFSGFDYVALGHLHRPQRAAHSHIRYPGSLLKYSFSEADHSKSVDVVEMDATGNCAVESVSLCPRRDVRKIVGFLNDLLKNPDPSKSRDDYLMVTLLDTGPILDAMSKLREVYPHVLHIERPSLLANPNPNRNSVDHRKLNDADLFAAFFAQVTGSSLSEAEAAAYQAVADELRRRDRESTQP